MSFSWAVKTLGSPNASPSIGGSSWASWTGQARPSSEKNGAATAEGAHERIANAVIVGGLGLGVRSDDGAQIIAEGDVHGRAVVERPGADPEEPVRQTGRLRRQKIGQRSRDVGLDRTASGAV